MTTFTTLAKMPPVWTYSPAGFPASPLVSLGNGSHKMTPAGCGPNSRDSFAFFDPASHCWKTSQVSLVPDLEISSVIWPRAGMTRNGIAYQLPPLAPLTAAIGFSSSLHFGPNSDHIWPTATTEDHGTRYAQGGMPLGMAARLWPTPLSRDHNDTGDLSRLRQVDTLPRVVQAVQREKEALWPTPCASDDRDRGNLSTPAVQRRKKIGKQLGLSMVVSKTSGNLNPQWVEWLMGFPAGWTDLED